MNAWLERIWFPLLVAALAVSSSLMLAIVVSSFFDFDTSSHWARLFSIPWYYFVALSGALFVGAAYAWKYSPQRQVESDAQQAEIQIWNKWFRAFQNGTTADYPKLDASRFGYLLKPGEICYMATARAVLGRGSAHQLEITESTNAGVDLKGIKFGQAAGTKDTYTTVRYDESHAGTLVITNQRVSFVSAPSLFIDILPEQILSIAWLQQYVMMRTNANADDSKNLVSIRIVVDVPPWVFASAIFRLKADNPTLPVPVVNPATNTH
jgi:hypothetical protein